MRKRPIRGGRPPRAVDSDAIPLSTRHVRDVMVLVVLKNGSYRGAEICGAFELVDASAVRVRARGLLSAEVRMTWYNWRPKKRHPRITFGRNDHIFLHHYTGQVIAEIGRPMIDD